MRQTRNVRILGACLLAMLAVAAVTASGASASLPELGGCEAAPTGHGKYKDSSCIEKVTGAAKKTEGDYEWYTGNAFAWVNNREHHVGGGTPAWRFNVGIGATTFETTGGHQIECSEGHGRLHVNLAQSTKEVFGGTFYFEGCHEVGGEEAECASSGWGGSADINDEGEGNNLEEGFRGTLGFLEGKGGESPKVGLSLTSHGKNEILMLAVCLGPEGTVWIGGNKKGGDAVISLIEPVDQMVGEGSETAGFTQTYASSGPGLQEWTSFERKHNSVLDEFVQHNFEQSSWNTTFKDTDEYPIEIKAKA
jgi:hypothetical protein